MVQLSQILTFLTLSALEVAAAHPGSSDSTDPQALSARRLFASNAQTSFKACEDSEDVRKLAQRTHSRRLDTIQRLRQELHARRDRRRQLAASDVLARSHKSTTVSNISKDSTSTVDATKLFGASPKCVLQPEVTHGPYYVSGELVRNDIRESQPGIDLYTEIQVMDTNTCKPVPALYMDFWHCNATGVYSGVVANGNGDSRDPSDLDTTFLRGLAPTNADGLVQFTTKFPGHYGGRTSHIHLLGSYGGELLANETYTGSRVANIGQIFFDQALISAVEATAVYTRNKAATTANADDQIFTQSASTEFDPVVNYVYLGDSVEDGIFSWISIGVDMKATKAVAAAATLTKDGGVASTGNVGMRGSTEYPKGPGAKPDAPPMNGTGAGDQGHGHGHGHKGEDDESSPRSAAFSVMFFLFSASALAALLYYFPVKKEPRRDRFAALNTA